MCLSGHAGGIDPATSQGLYFRDLRLVSRLEVETPGGDGSLLASRRVGSAVAHQVFAAATDRDGSPTALLWRRREVHAGAMVDRYRVEAYEEPLSVLQLTVRLESDFLPAIKDAGQRPQAAALTEVGSGWEAHHGRYGLRIDIDGPAPTAAAGVFSWHLPPIEPGSPIDVQLTVTALEDGQRASNAVRSAAVAPPPTLAMATGPLRWRASVASAVADVAALRMHVPELDVTFVAAGAPWFMALFGRDTLLTGWESLIGGVGSALEVLTALARFQGQSVDRTTGEEPGKILHELRVGGVDMFGLKAGRPYFGTVDASPLFVMLLAEVYRWGGDRDRVAELLPAARAALEWCVTSGDRDGDGYVEYAGDAALVNQGWKDSRDSMVHADGLRARGPIALSEVQAYVHAALLGLARLERDLGDEASSIALEVRAADLRTRFHRDFWLPGEQLVAMALDGDKRPLAVASSNMGHCLWAGILDDPVADVVATRLDEVDLRARWGLRTLSSRARAYNPLGYHLGTIWPHDAAIGAAGLRRYGHAEAALRATESLLGAAEHFEWRLPELFGGLDGDLPYPVPYPVACSPQAWSAAAPLLLLRTVLGIDPDVPAGRVAVAPALPDGVVLEVTGIPLGREMLAVRASGRAVQVLEAPAGIEFVDRIT